MKPSDQLTITMSAEERALLLGMLRRVPLTGDEALAYVQVKARLEAAQVAPAAPSNPAPAAKPAKR